MRPENLPHFVTVAGPGGILLKYAPQKSVWTVLENDKIVPYKIQKFSSKQYLKFLKPMKALLKQMAKLLLSNSWKKTKKSS